MKLARLRDKMSRHAPKRFARWKRRRLQYADKKLEERLRIAGLMTGEHVIGHTEGHVLTGGQITPPAPKLSLWQRFLAWFRRWAER